MKRKRDDVDIIRAVNDLSTPEYISKHGCNLAPDHHAIIDNVHVHYHKSPADKNSVNDTDALSDEDMLACRGLVEQTCRADYEASSIGWHPRRKLKEMRDNDMRYLIVRKQDAEDKTTTFMGFCSFMFTHEDGIPVVYIYEIHLQPSLRGQRIGHFLMTCVETMGASVGVRKSMLTVFRANVAATKWYRKLGYEVDESSPSDKPLRGATKQADYLIMSKALRKPLVETDTQEPSEGKVD